MQRLGNLHAALVEYVKRSLPAFAVRAWPVVEQTRALMPSVAIDAFGAVGQEIAERGGRWAVSCPPGVSKSLWFGVILPAWLLLRSGGTARIMCGSYAWDLAVRDSRRCRDLVSSPWYRSLVGDRWSLRGDANTDSDWWTTVGGRRLVTSTGAKALGERATFQILDDVLSGADVWSATKRKEAARWVNEVMPSRLEDPEHDTRIIVGQRLHPSDPIGVCLQLGGWQYLRLPALADEAPCELTREDGSVIWRDPRAPGEPLLALLATGALEQLKRELGSSAFAAQYQQNPHDDSASMFPRSCFTRRWTELPQFSSMTIALDASFKAGASSDFAVISAWGASMADRYLVEQWRKQAGFADTLEALRGFAARWPFARIVVESAANGHAIVDQLQREIPAVFGVKPVGSKVARAASVQAIVESGAVVLPAHAPWIDAWIDEVSTFPNAQGNRDDQTDSMVWALRDLAIREADSNQIIDAGYRSGDEVHGGYASSSSSFSSNPYAFDPYAAARGPR